MLSSSYQAEPGSKRDKPACPQLPELANLPSFSYPHGRKDNGKIVVMIIQHSLGLLHQASLAADLSSNLGGGGLEGRVSDPEPRAQPTEHHGG